LPIWASDRCRLVDVDNAVLAGIFGFAAGAFPHSTLRRHLTAQQQDKSDYERDANNRRRSESSEILHLDASSLPIIMPGQNTALRHRACAQRKCL
jgi:hypothetical protein